ncbi:glycosyltransferase [Candidatus Pelagibacter giovannonii]|uniref:Glycosyltransferase n=1 Tax=Candidatus Pelagibacter giovannonii TaxID=2563896 RepID=A0A6H1Q1K4_9PROT|nr:glycosyltransferase [Candidatus Pelagibacter giovannonii]
MYYSKNNLLNKLYFFYYLFFLIFITLVAKPDVIIVYNNYPILFVKIVRLFFKKKIIYHNFDYNPNPKSIFARFINFIEKKSIHLFDLVVFSNEERIKLFKKINNIKNFPTIALFNVLTIKHHKYFLKLKKKRNKKIIKVFRIGSIGPGHGLLPLINSFKFLPGNYKLTLCGEIMDNNFYSKLKKIIEKKNISKKIKFITSAKRSRWEWELSNSDIGVAFYENVSFSHKYMVGASQKVNSYLAAKLPIIAYKDKQFLEFHKKYRCCILIDNKDPKKLANTINKEIQNTTNFNKLKKNSFLAFKNTYNFENEINKIKKYLL